MHGSLIVSSLTNILSIFKLTSRECAFSATTLSRVERVKCVPRAKRRTRFNLIYIPRFDGINGHAPRSLRLPGPRSRKKSFLRVCARARARESTRGRRTRAMQCGMHPGLWNAARGRDAANIPARTRAILRTGRGSRVPIEPSWGEGTVPLVEEGQES